MRVGIQRTAASRASSSHMFSASEVLALLEDQEDFEAELGKLASTVDLDAESEDDNEAQGYSNPMALRYC